MSTDDTNGNQFDGTDYRKESALRELYWGRQMSSRDIADHFGIAKTTVLRWMKRNGIERRDRTNSPATFYLNSQGREMWAVNENGKTENVSVQRLTAVSEYGFESVCGNDTHHEIPIPWLNYPENIVVKDPSEHRKMHNMGESNCNAKLNAKDVKEIKTKLESSGVSKSDLADEYGISQQTVKDIESGKSWSHVTP